MINKKHIIIIIAIVVIYFLFFYKNPFNGYTWYQRQKRNRQIKNGISPISKTSVIESNYSPVEYANYPNLTGNPVADIAILNQAGFRYDH